MLTLNAFESLPPHFLPLVFISPFALLFIFQCICIVFFLFLNNGKQNRVIIGLARKFLGLFSDALLAPVSLLSDLAHSLKNKSQELI